MLDENHQFFLQVWEYHWHLPYYGGVTFLYNGYNYCTVLVIPCIPKPYLSVLGPPPCPVEFSWFNFPNLRCSGNFTKLKLGFMKFAPKHWETLTSLIFYSFLTKIQLIWKQDSGPIKVQNIAQCLFKRAILNIHKFNRTSFFFISHYLNRQSHKFNF